MNKETNKEVNKGYKVCPHGNLEGSCFAIHCHQAEVKPEVEADTDSWQERFDKDFDGLWMFLNNVTKLPPLDKTGFTPKYKIKSFLSQELKSAEEKARRHLLETVKELSEEKKEDIQSLLDQVKKNVGLLRQWLNEKPKDMLVTNEHIERFLELNNITASGPTTGKNK